MTDESVARFRDEIRTVDRELTAAVNRRLELVAELKRYKDANGLPFVDAEREKQLLDERLAENPGPLSDEGLRAFYVELLALIKRELERS
jgi:chorismate mutase / prephenate dehydratase